MDSTVNKIMGTITSNENDINSKVPIQNQLMRKICVIYLSNTLTSPGQHQIE